MLRILGVASVTAITDASAVYWRGITAPTDIDHSRMAHYQRAISKHLPTDTCEWLLGPPMSRLRSSLEGASIEDQRQRANLPGCCRRWSLDIG